MISRTSQNAALQESFASKLACAMAQSLFNPEVDRMVSIRHAHDDMDEDEFIANMPDEMVQTTPKRPWEAPELALADTMTEAEICAATSAGSDPLAQSSDTGGRTLRKGDPSPSLIATAFGLAKLVDSEDHLQDLFRPGRVTHFACPAGSFIEALEEILPKVIRHLQDQLPSGGTVDLHYHVKEEDGDRRLKGRHRSRDFMD